MIVMLCGESPWPTRSGGRVRAAGLHSAVSASHDVRVLVARRRDDDQVSDRAEALPASSRSRTATVVGAGPRLGRGLLDDRSRQVVAEACRDASALLVQHSYLAHELPRLAVPVVLDLQNVEAVRQAALGGALGRLEGLKARRWEPRVLRAVDLVVAVDDREAAHARRVGARRVVVVPNVAEVPRCGPSPPDGAVLAVGDWTYGPNAEGLAALLPVVQDLPVPFVLAGRGSEQHGGLGFVDDVSALYEQAAVVVSPVVRGAGTQLKVVEALTRGRVVVTTTYGARSVPPGAEVGVEVADGAADLRAALVRLVRDIAERHRREAALAATELPRSWAVAAAPLIAVLTEVARG